MNNIRNFSIIAHIDHGKSTLADRIIEHGDNHNNYKNIKRLLDNMELEKERGITIKLNAVKIKYNDYTLNLIDTPGHVDFSYEVSRSLAACEGALLIVDAAQGIEAQTLANLYLALENDLTIIPVVNKIDLPNANIPKVIKEIKDMFGFKKEDIILASGKTGEGITEIINAIIDRIPAPNIDNDEDKALIFDSYYDPYKGVIAACSVKSGSFKKGDSIKMFNTDNTYEIIEMWENTPEPVYTDVLETGHVGFINASIKTIDDVKIGDTITTKKREAKKPLVGYKEMMPTVFSGIYPVEPNKYNSLKEALLKLKLNDSSLTYEPESSNALGFGFRCGFLGLLHLEIIEERITREFDIEVITTSPSVIYKINLTNGEEINIDNPSMFPNRTHIVSIKEPYIKAEILTPNEYIGKVMELCQNKRGNYITTEYIDESRMTIKYELPLAEIVYDFYDKLKSYTKGYASFDYEVSKYKESDLIKLDILINGEIVDALSVITHRKSAQSKGRSITKQLSELIPRQLFEVPIQASIGSKVISRENVRAVRKNVLAKCYGGDISRKKKLLQKQKEGKKKMKMVGNVEIPKEAFLSVLKNED